MPEIGVGRQVCGTLEESSRREWLVTDGTGGYAMGTVSGLRTRRYHGLLVVATDPPMGRRLALASLDPTVVIGDRRTRLATHEWAGGVVDPKGFEHLESFVLRDGLPKWRWSLGDVVVERELAMTDGRPVVGVVHRLVRAPYPIRLDVDALCTWRDVHGERLGAGNAFMASQPDGFVFEHALRVRGPGFEPDGAWYRDVRYRDEAGRGLNDREDLFHAGRFSAWLAPGQEIEVTAWAGNLDSEPFPARAIIEAARRRAGVVMIRARPQDDTDELLALAADQFVVSGPAVVAGYPWFGDWSRDSMTSYEGLFLETGRMNEGRNLLLRAAATLSEGMLANTADVGGLEYNAADATLWFLHAVGRHVDVTGDIDLGAALCPRLEQVVDHHVAGTRFGIGVDPSDGLLTQGAEGWALTWMDARLDGRPVTPRAGKAVEVNALWINGLATVAGLQQRLGRDASRTRALEQAARRSFASRFETPAGLLDVVDGPNGDVAEVRPSQLLAVSLPHVPLASRSAVDACRPLLTSLGLRSLAPDDLGYRGRHRGGPADRDLAYHQGTVWPWLIGPYVEATLRVWADGKGTDVGADPNGILDGLEAHMKEWGLGSVSETADGDPPHDASGCPFQAWSVAELLRARRLLQRNAEDRDRPTRWR